MNIVPREFLTSHILYIRVKQAWFCSEEYRFSVYYEE